jgi:hypothetical protein
MIVHLLVEVEVVGWVLLDVSLDKAVDLEGSVEQEVHPEHRFNLFVCRYTYVSDIMFIIKKKKHTFFSNDVF